MGARNGQQSGGINGPPPHTIYGGHGIEKVEDHWYRSRLDCKWANVVPFFKKGKKEDLGN